MRNRLSYRQHWIPHDSLHQNCHRNIKSMSNKIYRYPHLKNVFEKHKRIRIVHIVFFHNHGNQLITQYKCNNHPRNGDNDIIRQIFIMEKMPLFQFWGVFPTSVAIVSTLVFTSVNMVSRFDVIQPVSRSFMNSVIFSVIPPIYLSKQSCKLWNQVYSNQYDATARHQLFYVFYEKIFARNEP